MAFASDFTFPEITSGKEPSPAPRDLLKHLGDRVLWESTGGNRNAEIHPRLHLALQALQS
jgi:hypothetical protein